MRLVVFSLLLSALLGGFNAHAMSQGQYAGCLETGRSQVAIKKKVGAIGEAQSLGIIRQSVVFDSLKNAISAANSCSELDSKLVEIIAPLAQIYLFEKGSSLSVEDWMASLQ